MQDKNIHTVYLGENYGALVQVPSEIHVIDPQRAGKVLNIFKDGNGYKIAYFDKDGMLTMKSFSDPEPIPASQGQTGQRTNQAPQKTEPPEFYLFGYLPE